MSNKYFFYIFVASDLDLDLLTLKLFHQLVTRVQIAYPSNLNFIQFIDFEKIVGTVQTDGQSATLPSPREGLIINHDVFQTQAYKLRFAFEAKLVKFSQC